MIFSIVTVTFNNFEGLKKTYHSINFELEDLFEWVVIDGASSDGTKDWLSNLQMDNLNWVSESDNGIFDAMNKGIARSNGQYLIFMNAGDLFSSKEILLKLKDFLDNSNNPDLIYGDTIEYDTDGDQYLKAARSPVWNHYSMFTHHQSIFYKKEKIINGYDLTYKLSGDWALTSRLLAEKNIVVEKFPEIVCYFERGGVSQRNDQRELINKEHWRILRKEMKLSYVSALVLYNTKLVFNKLRQFAPNLYNAFRFKKS